MRAFDFERESGLSLCAYAWETEGQRANLCIVHGLGEHAGRYAEMAEAMNRAGIGVYAYDQRGHGRSGGKRAVARLAQLSDDARDFANRIRRENGLPTLLFGHSMGGGVGLHTLLFNRPEVAGGIITSPWLRLVDPPPKALLSVVRALPGVFGGMNLKNGLKASLLCHDEKVCKWYGEDPLNHEMVGFLLAADMQFAGERTIDGAASLESPLLLCHGDSDGICDVEGSKAFAKTAGDQCRFVCFEGMYHEIHNEPEAKAALFEKEIAFVESLL